MKFLRYILANIARNKLRTTLAIFGIATALFLFCFLEGVLAALNVGTEVANLSRLVTRNAISLVQPLPIAYEAKIRAIDGVEVTTHQNWFGAQYKAKKSEFFAQFSVDPESFLQVYSEVEMPEEEEKAFIAERDSCIIGRKLADRLDKKVGDKIVLEGSIHPGDWEFNVRGIYHGTETGTDESSMFFHYEYVNQSLPDYNQGLIGLVVLKLKDSSRAAAIAKTIDSQFENSAYGTRTESEKAFAAGFVSMFGNIPLLLRGIGAAVAFTLLMVAANTMIMAGRERTREVGILKTIGYSNRLIFFLLLSESVAIAMIGGLLGCFTCRILFQFTELDSNGMLPIFEIPWVTVVIGLVIAFATGLLSGVFPAISATRLHVVHALRRF